jgi:ribosomal protein L29
MDRFQVSSSTLQHSHRYLDSIKRLWAVSQHSHRCLGNMDLARIHAISNPSRDSQSSNNKEDVANLRTLARIHAISNPSRNSLISNNKKDVANLRTLVRIHAISNPSRDSLSSNNKEDVVRISRTLVRINAQEMKD